MVRMPLLMLCMIGLQVTRAQVPIEDELERELSEAIQDNSFYVEEAFNQEPGVVQHISTLSYFPSPQKDIIYTFTQEWPLGSEAHQFSVTVPYEFLDGNAVVGIGDVLLNYRYQMMTMEQWAVCAPRLSVVLPTGDGSKSLGNDVIGFQCNLPVSKRLSRLFIVHANAGATLLPNVKGRNLSGRMVERTLTSYTVGGSVILLAAPTVNFLFEAGSIFLSQLEHGSVVHSTETFLSPGARVAINVDNLQIVPGLAAPCLRADGVWQTGVFFYLSFEHPF